ncbi:MAG: type VI secretion system Vgr family protein [Planctomycetota bacterium]|jgi:type VI secretion system secreted protein VgrG
MADKPTQKNRELAIETPLGEDVLLLISMSGTEQLGRPFEYRLELASENGQIKVENIVGQNVTIRLELGADRRRYFNGHVSQFTQLTSAGQLARYRATVVPWLWFLSRTADCRIFQDKTVPDIIKQIFRDRGFTNFEDGLTGSYQAREYCVQYRETEFSFVNRLMEQEGIYYYFKHDNGKHSLVLADSYSAHEPYPEFDKLTYQPADTGPAAEEYISDWAFETNLQPGSYALNDFDFKNSKNDLQARANVDRKHTAADFEIYDYPGDYVKTKDGEEYARKRIEELQAGYEVATAKSNSRGLCTGFLFNLTGHPRDDQNKEHLITSANYTIKGDEVFSAGAGTSEFTFSCDLTAIDSSQPFRSPRTTPKPKVSGPQTAIVVGPSDEEIHTDKYGRVKVKFHWDRYSKADENSSCWIRVAQVWAGRKWGAMYIPRIGQEVIVEFLEGDPNRPIITGRVYNAQARPPYDLPGNKTISTLRSNSSKGGGGFNEIRFEDKKGEEQIFIRAEKDEDARVKNDAKEWVGADRHLIVNRDQLEEVRGDKHLTVKGDQNEKIDGTVSLNAGMDLQQKAGMKHALEAGMDIHIKGGMKVVIEAGMQLSLKAGANFIDIGPGGVSISGTPTVMLNSGGSAGSGSGASPDAAKLPKEAATAEPGQVSGPPPSQPPPGPLQPAPPVKPSPQAVTLQQAAKDGTPFCEECEKAKNQ